MSCQSNQKDTLVGKWENESMTVKVNSSRGEEGKDSTIVVKAGEWVERMRIQPIQTTYNEDGTWESNYFDINDKNVFTIKGSWTATEDTLYMQQLSPKKELNIYRYQINGDRVEFLTVIDWDSDGIADDNYQGIQVRSTK